MEQYERDAPLFDRRLQVLVQFPDREEKLQQLTVRLLHGVRVRVFFVFMFSQCVQPIRLQHGAHHSSRYTGRRQQNSSTNQKERVFRVEVTDDCGADPYFLFLWSVSEDEFHELKQQQRLLVDFAAFPTSLIELLQCCLKDSNRVTAVSADSDHEVELNPLSRSQGPVPLRCAPWTLLYYGVKTGS